MAGIIDYLLWLVLPGKWDIVENIVESVEEQKLFPHKREYPHDHQMGQRGFVNRVDRG